MDPLDAGLAQQVGQVIDGRWTLRRLIGAGGMAAVYAAEDAAGQTVALKLLYPEMARRRDIRERFVREASVMARIVHPGMVKIFGQGQSSDQAYLVMELLVGETVAERVRRLGRLEVREVLAILDQVLDVLVLAHSLGVIHRDLKPENLFCTKEGRIKVLDFGLARLLDSPAESFRTRTGAALGTLPYMAPEQALGKRDEVDARTDVFAVGATAFRLLTGRRIHEAPSEAELLMCMASQQAPSISVVAPELAPTLGAVVDRALAFAKARRYPDALTMQNDVRALIGGQLPAFAAASREREEQPTRTDRQAPAIVAAATPPISSRPQPAPAVLEPVPPTALNATAYPTQPDLAAEHPSRALPATVVMPASARQKATVAETPARQHAATIPRAPVSDLVLQRRRRRTLWIGLTVLLGLFGAATAGALLLILDRGSRERPSELQPSSSASAGLTPSQTSAPDVAPPVLRHPPHSIAPLDDPTAPPPLLPPRGPRRQRPSLGATSNLPPPPSMGSIDPLQPSPGFAASASAAIPNLLVPLANAVPNTDMLTPPSSSTAPKGKTNSHAKKSKQHGPDRN
ncbi:MAG TPA: protein kinase [Polyangiaceae bacterium]|nr:protein kinase [Polyangiaceae bacterium]